MSEKREYQKKNLDYWKNRASGLQKDPVEQSVPVGIDMESYASFDSGSTGSVTAGRRKNAVTGQTSYFSGLENISGLPLPFKCSKSGGVEIIDVAEICELCQKAYAHVGVFRNAVDVMTEFSSTPIRLKGGDKKAQKLIKAWLAKTCINNFTKQFFREYFRSGNVFVYEFKGKFAQKELASLDRLTSTAGRVKSYDIPLKFTIINPVNIAYQATSNFSSFNYQKLMSASEINALRLQKNDTDKKVFENLPAEIKKEITKKNFSGEGIYLSMEEKSVTTIFYKKQDYEPFAIPFGFPVLKDINFKLELKKVDQALARTVQNITLLITMGAEPEKGGVNQKAIAAMQEIFKSQSVSRVIVSDYTTKGQFLVPDVASILDPKKYEIVNRDIVEGLMLLIFGQEEKFSNQETKAQIFIERLEEGRQQYLELFIQPKINEICKAVGITNPPKAVMQEVNLKNKNELSRIYTRLLELGVLTPSDAIEALETGFLPDKETLDGNQEEYIKQRKDGKYNPLIAGTPTTETPEGIALRKTQVQIAKMNADTKQEGQTEKPAGKKQMSSVTKKSGPNPNASGNGRPSTAKASVEVPLSSVKTSVKAVGAFLDLASEKVKGCYQVDSLDENQQGLVDSVSEKIIASYDSNSWLLKLEEFLGGNEVIAIEETEQYKKICEYADENNIPVLSAALIHHASK